MKKSIYTKDHKKLVGRIKKARKEAGYDQTKAGKLLGATQSYISKMESGQRKIDIIQLKEISRVYKKKITYFIP